MAAVILLFSGRYQRPLFNLLMGFNRWIYRVTTYVRLMRDEYPPFRLDQGPLDIGERGPVPWNAPAPPDGPSPRIGPWPPESPVPPSQTTAQWGERRRRALLRRAPRVSGGRA
ncbi:MAG: hypothetical protein NVS2B15_08370 [Pseudarthrobacter sp.]